ncbi:MAG: HpcH/HpaI aldolase family protein [Thermoleophilaceae bacterium]
MNLDRRAREAPARPLVGTVISAPDPSLAESIARAFDFVWIDLEHSALSLRDMQTLVLAVQGAGCAAHVRLPRRDSEHLPAVLDAGVDGIVAPMVETASAATTLVRRLRYPPNGSRGFGPRRAGGHGRTPAFWATPESRVACTVQIESPRAVDNVAAIAAVDGVDALVVGTADLSFGLGRPQELDSRPMREAIEKVEAAASAHGVACGLAAGGDPKTIREAMGGRSRLAVYSVDVRMYASAVDAAAAAMREALEGVQEGVRSHVVD